MLFAAISCVLAGCSLMPEYLRPAPPVPAAWPDNGKPVVAQRVDVDDWQSYFPDKRLQVLIATALENNRDMRIATARIAEARALYGVQQADRQPNLNLAAARNASLTPAGASVTGRSTNADRHDVNVSLVSFELDFWGRINSLSEAAKASYLATESAQRAFRLSLIAEVANAYLLSLEMRERIQLTEAASRTRAETRELILRRRKLGVSNDMDFLQADGAFQAVLAEHANLERQQAAAENLLGLLVGRSMSEMKNLPEGQNLAGQGIAPGLIAGLPANVLLQRPDVLAAEQKLIAANANIGAARAAFFPRISLTGSLGVASRNLTGLFEGDSGAWSFQPALSLPLFDAGRNQANTGVAEARKIAAVAEYEKTIQQAFREVADLLNARDKLSEQLVAQQANVETQNRRLRLVEARYEAGIISHLEVLDAQREYYAAQQNALQVRRLMLLSSAQLYKALAGQSATDSPQRGKTK